MTEKECVIYKGNFFQIEWYYTEKGESQPYDYYKACDVAQQRKFLMLCQRMKSEKLIAINNRNDYLNRFSDDKEEDEK